MKFLSLEEVNQIIPQLEQIMARVEKFQAEHNSKHDSLLIHEILSDLEKKNGKTVNKADLEAQELDGALEQIEGEVEQIRLLGGVIRSLENGRIDFPAKHQGEAIYFSWKKGESAISFYYPQKGPYNNRLPLN